MIQVAVLGAKGRMGSEVVRAVEAADDLELAGAFDVGASLQLRAGAGAVGVTPPGAGVGHQRGW
ncbi:MAG: 4-hydroxy-tetrahydrodipicolinate reductase, partial [Frankiaceae bacterium]|nr:4-hydroxy-tetrahydrodipicolinate reductase [Frankiaceae bacterium]